MWVELCLESSVCFVLICESKGGGFMEVFIEQVKIFLDIYYSFYLSIES